MNRHLLSPSTWGGWLAPIDAMPVGVDIIIVILFPPFFLVSHIQQIHHNIVFLL